jgi:hypothetical protein
MTTGEETTAPICLTHLRERVGADQPTADLAFTLLNRMPA